MQQERMAAARPRVARVALPERVAQVIAVLITTGAMTLVAVAYNAVAGA